jgi:hypothetical protein
MHTYIFRPPIAYIYVQAHTWRCIRGLFCYCFIYLHTQAGSLVSGFNFTHTLHHLEHVCFIIKETSEKCASGEKKNWKLYYSFKRDELGRKENLNEN